MLFRSIDVSVNTLFIILLQIDDSNTVEQLMVTICTRLGELIEYFTRQHHEIMVLLRVLNKVMMARFKIITNCYCESNQAKPFIILTILLHRRV